MNSEEIAHLAGVFDAVGTLTVHITKNDRYTIGYQFQPMIRLFRPAGKEDPLMGKLMAFCDERGIKYGIAEKAHAKDRDSTSYEWKVKNPESIERFLEPLLPYLVTTFPRATLMLEQIIPRVKDGHHTEKETFYELMKYADELRGPINKGTDAKYTQEYFEKEWGLVPTK